MLPKIISFMVRTDYSNLNAVLFFDFRHGDLSAFPLVICGGRLIMNYNTIGGVQADIAPDFQKKVKEFIPYLRGMETLCAFLNGEGGTVLFGVTDKGKIIGQDVSDKTKRDIADAVWRIEPFATVEVSYTEIPDTGKSVIALSAEERFCGMKRLGERAVFLSTDTES